MTNAPVSEVPDEHMHEFPSSIKEMVQDPDVNDADRASDLQRTHDYLVGRHDEFREEFRKRREQGRFASTDTLSSIGSARHHTFTDSESVNQTETEKNDPGSSSSNNKIKYYSDSENDEPNSKRVKTEKIEGSSGEDSNNKRKHYSDSENDERDSKRVKTEKIEDSLGEDNSGEDYSGQDSSGQDSSGKDSSGKGPSDQGASGKGPSGKGPSDQDPSDQYPSNENTGGNSSRIDYVLEKQSCEMPDIFDADGGN